MVLTKFIRFLLCCGVFHVLIRATLGESKNEYMKRRTRLLGEERRMRTGADVVLSKAEQAANQVLMGQKLDEIMDAMDDPSTKFAPAVHFFKAKNQIDKSNVMQILRTMPKGAVLHVHESSIVDVMWVIKKATYLNQCYMCHDHKHQLHFRFFQSPPRSPGCPWKNVVAERNRSHDSALFDKWLYRNMSLVVDEPAHTYPTQAAVWGRFQGIFTALGGLVFYAPVFRAYVRQALETFHSDNVQYMELRVLLNPVYELDGTTHDERWVVRTYQSISEQFRKEHSDFVGIKLIISASRSSSTTAVADAILGTVELQSEFPDFVVGFDLVGREDPGYPLYYFLDELLMPSQSRPPVRLPYFFHAGETDWSEEDVDENLEDALLLNTSRIGHGFALPKHPLLAQRARERAVPIELCPISNQVLKLVDDLRDHPAAMLLAAAQPIVVSSDDPALWGATGVSYDWYEMFMGIAGGKDDLRLLKKLALDSIRYSAMTDAEKQLAMKIWQVKWEEFIHRAHIFGRK